jgi:RNA polymerase sigma-70 factor (ECF subfamily)
MSPERALRRREGAPYSGHVLDARNSTQVVGHEGEEMDLLDDSVLWSRSRSGDVDAFTALFERHATTIYNYCFRRLGDWGAAEEMLSLVFLEAWRRRNKELPKDKVLPWLYGIATNVVRNRRRSERRFRAALTRMPPDPPEPGFEEEVDDRLDDERRIRSALELLGQLSRREQDVFVLCAWSGLSYDDAGLALGIPVGTVRSRLSRARRRLGELDLACGHEQRETPSVEEALER